MFLLGGNLLCSGKQIRCWNLCFVPISKRICLYAAGCQKSVRLIKSAVDNPSIKKHCRTEPKVFDRLTRVPSTIQGRLRMINNSIAFVQHPIDKTRVFIFGTDRHKALNGDIVNVFIYPIGQWKVIETEESSRQPENHVPAIADETVIPVDESIETEFEDISITAPVAAELSISTLKRLTGNSILTYKSLSQVMADPNSNVWPHGLPKDLDLCDYSYAFRPLPSPNLIRTGHVIDIEKADIRSRRFLGHIAFCGPSRGRITRKSLQLDVDAADAETCLFVPNSLNQSIIKLDPFRLPPDVKENHDRGLQGTYVCTVTGWNHRLGLPHGYISDQIGDLNHLDDATKALLVEFGIEDREFTEEHLRGLPKSPEEFKIPEGEYLKRRDFRSRCIMSIDPSTAKDIDDALHIKQINPDLYEVGVHIADVSYFVKPGSPLDREAARRTTSVYLVQKVIPMLPSILSDHLCSLHPSTDKLAFSVIMKVRPTGEVIDSWFGRTIIRSRLKLSYEQALAILERPIGEALSELVPHPEPPFTLHNVQVSLMHLNNIARKLREKRIEGGALTLQKAKIEFDLPSTLFDTEATKSAGSDTALQSTQKTRDIWPRGFSIQSPGPSHQLIEEWMLVANQTVARRIFEAFCHRHASDTTFTKTSSLRSPNTDNWLGVLLRNHAPPLVKRLNDLANLLKAGGIHLTDASSKNISIALREHDRKLKESGCNDTERKVIMNALSHLVYVRMNMAKYFSLDELLSLRSELAELIKSNPEVLFEYTWHYGLNVPLYTHFTSPIRRYADLVVHRQLAVIIASSSTQGPKPRESADNRSNILIRRRAVLSRLGVQAEWCNVKRMMARRAQEANQRLFLTACLRDCGPITMNVTVTDYNESTIGVLLSEIGLLIKVPLKKFFELATTWQLVSPESKVNQPQDLHATTANNDEPKPVPHLLVEWSSDSHSDDSGGSVNTQSTSTSRKEIHILTVLPCSIFSLKNRLTLSARFLPSNIRRIESDTVISQTPAVSVHKQDLLLPHTTPAIHTPSPPVP